MTQAANLASVGSVLTPDSSGNVSISGKKYQAGGVTTNALAWVNFNGTGTVAIRSSYNVSSITDNGTGLYTVNFTNAMANVNYCAVFGVSSNATTVPVIYENGFAARSTSALPVVTYGPISAALFDSDSVNITIFGQ